MSKFWEVKNLSDSEAELILYGQIAGERPWWDGDKDLEIIVPSEFIEDMRLLNTKSKIIIRLNSPGGDVFAAHAIYTQLKTSKARKEVIVDGVAASAATIIMMAGDVVKAPSNALIMIHNPAVFAYDYMTEADLVQLTEAVRTVKDSILEAYMQKATVSKDELSDMMDETKWMTGSEAKDIGLVDKVLFETANISASADRRFLFVNNTALDIGAYKTKPDFPGLKIRQEAKKEMSMQTQTAAPQETVPVANNAIPLLPPQIENTAQLEEHFPALVAMIRNDAAAAERKRIQEIEEISAQIPTELVNEAKFLKPIDAQALSFRALKANAALGSAYLNNAQADAGDSGAEDVGGAPGAGGAPPKAKTVGDLFRDIVSGFERGASAEE